MNRTLYIVPAFHHQQELNVVCTLLENHDTLIIDDGSVPSLHANKKIIRHNRNLGYGAAQKTGFGYALSNGYEQIALIHGDNQYSIPHIIQAAMNKSEAPVLLGSRFLSSTKNIPLWRKWGNRLLTSSANRRFGVRHSDLHTGARIYSTKFLKKLPYHSFSNGFLFDHQLLIWAIRRGIAIEEFSIPAKYDNSVSSIPFGTALYYGVGCLRGLIVPTSL